MNKKAKMYVGLGVVAVVAYYFYHQAQMKKAAAAAPATKSMVGFAATDSTGQSKF
jgi:uncharacterized membrane protein YebE (DUF533 family)